MKSSISLNSSYPKSKLYCSDSRITSHCRKCEDWQEKDILYAIGVSQENKLKLLWMIYGDCYAADREIYERVTNKITNGILEIPEVEFSETKELGRINKVDPLGITYLRIRGMWGIDNPLLVYKDVFTYQDNSGFQLVTIMKQSKYLSFTDEDRAEIENIAITDNKLSIKDVEVKSPNNPAQLIPAKIIYYRL